MKRIKQELYESDDIGLMPLSDEAKEIFYCLTNEGLTCNFKPILKLSKEEISKLISDNVSSVLCNVNKKDIVKLKSLISAVLLKKYSDYNFMYDFSSIDYLISDLSKLCDDVINNIIDMTCKNILDDCVVGIDEFCCIDDYNKTYNLCVGVRENLVSELDRLDNTYSFSYSDNVSGENDDAYVRYNFLLKDLDYFDDVLSNGMLINEESVKYYYDKEKSNCSLNSYANIADIYKIISRELFDGNIDDLKFVRLIYKELSKTVYWKKLPHLFRKNFHKFMKSDFKENGFKL